MPAGTDGGSKTLERGLRVLQVLAGRREGVTVSELARILGTHRAGIYRLLGPLLEHRLVARTETGGLTLGLGVLELAQGIESDLQDVAAPHLRELADALSATAALTVLDGEEAVVAAAAEPRHTSIHVAYRVGLRHRADVGASGLAILAGRPATPGERGEVTRARRRGYATSAGELQPAAFGVAVPIMGDGGNAIASIGIVALEPLDEKPVSARLQSAARAIAAAL
jgi:DNA-binding IclR family transcriptional regulator